MFIFSLNSHTHTVCSDAKTKSSRALQEAEAGERIDLRLMHWGHGTEKRQFSFWLFFGGGGGGGCVSVRACVCYVGGRT